MEDFRGYSQVVQKLRNFFQQRLGFVEVPAQSRLSILAACEDPNTITQFVFDGVNYPLPQTGQMWLEMELLRNPDLPGFFCVTTSYRNEPSPIPGRHEKIFPMFEFEARGNVDAMKAIELELLKFLGFPAPTSLLYDEICERYGVLELGAAHEIMMQQDFGNVLSLEQFPKRTHPFWNMKQRTEELYNKVDVLLYGMETIGSAERSSNVAEMRSNFLSVSNGQYAALLFDAFGKDRVMKELDEYLALPMFPRFGAGIGVTRMTRAMRLAGLLDDAALNKKVTTAA